MLQWGHADHSVEDLILPINAGRRETRFNGATPITAWKTTYVTGDCACDMPASMGPRR